MENYNKRGFNYERRIKQALTAKKDKLSLIIPSFNQSNSTYKRSLHYQSLLYELFSTRDYSRM